MISLVTLVVTVGCAAPPPVVIEKPARVGPVIVHEEPSPFGRVLVIDYGRRRHLRFDEIGGDDQSMIDLDDVRAVPMDYIRCAALGMLLPPAVERVAMIGLGGGTFSGLVHRGWPEVTIDVAEINPVVVEVAKRFFFVTPDARLRLHLGDGRRFLAESEAGFDVVMVDAYVGAGIPEHLRGRDFFAVVRQRLRPGGVLVANLSTDAATEAALIAAIGGAFTHLACLRTEDTLNLEVFASAAPLPAHATLAARAAAADAAGRTSFALRPLVDALGRCGRRGRSAAQ